jgi:hypothetical protein
MSAPSCSASQRRPSQVLRRVLLALLARVFDLGRMADVRERQLGTGVGEQVAEDERVLVVRRVVVGDDRVRRHVPSVESCPSVLERQRVGFAQTFAAPFHNDQ